MKHLLRIIISGLVGGGAWVVGMIVFFGPAQIILANPQLQSTKFLAVVEQIEPLPRMVGNMWIVVIGLLLIGIIYGFVFSLIGSQFTGTNIQKGMKFGFTSWALMVPWFEFYLPWNVMHEPVLLVLLEVFLWACVMLLVGISISLTYGFLESKMKNKLLF